MGERVENPSLANRFIFLVGVWRGVKRGLVESLGREREEE